MSDGIIKRRKPGNPMGKVPGTRNRNSGYVRVALDKLDYNVIQRFIETAEELPPNERLAALKYLMRFAFPIIKEIDAVVANQQIMEEEILDLKPAGKSDQELLDEVSNDVLIGNQ